MILVKTFYAFNELRNFSYLITDKNTGHAWVIDPYEANPIIDYIKKNGLVLKGILNTHDHFDHIRGNEPLAHAFHAKVCKLKNSDTIPLSDGFLIETLNSPGHTLDHQVFLWKKENKPLALFSGDTLFNSGVGNCKNGGDVNLLYSTTIKLGELSDDTLLYPGHDYRKNNLNFALSVEPENPKIKEALKTLEGHETHELPPATLGEEKQVNPFLRLDSQELQEKVMKEGYDKKDIFIKLRSMRDQW